MAKPFLVEQIQQFFNDRMSKCMKNSMQTANATNQTFLGQAYSNSQNPGLFSQNPNLDPNYNVLVAANGQTYKGYVSGNPSTLDAAVRISTDEAVQIEEAYRSKEEEEALSKVLILYGNHLQAQLELFPLPPLFYIYDVVSNERYVLEDDDTFFDPPSCILSPPDVPVFGVGFAAPPTPGGFYAHLSSDGKHLTITKVTYTVDGYQTLNATDSALIEWRIYKNIKLVNPTEVDAPGTIRWTTVESGSHVQLYSEFADPPAPPPVEGGTTTSVLDCFDPITGVYLGDSTPSTIITVITISGIESSSTIRSFRILPVVTYVDGKPQVSAAGAFKGTRTDGYGGTATVTTITCGGSSSSTTHPSGGSTSSAISGLFFIDKLGDSTPKISDLSQNFEVFTHDVYDLSFDFENTNLLNWTQSIQNDPRWFVYAKSPGQESLLAQSRLQEEFSLVVHGEIVRLTPTNGAVTDEYEYVTDDDGNLSSEQLEQLAILDARIFDNTRLYKNIPESWHQNTFNEPVFHNNIFGLGPNQNKVIDTGKVLRLEIAQTEEDHSLFIATAYLFVYDPDTDLFVQKKKFQAKAGTRCLAYFPPNQAQVGGGFGTPGYLSTIKLPDNYLAYYSANTYVHTLPFSTEFLFASQGIASTVCDMVLVD